MRYSKLLSHKFRNGKFVREIVKILNENIDMCFNTPVL